MTRVMRLPQSPPWVTRLVSSVLVRGTKSLTIMIIPKLKHQLVASLSIVLQSKATLFDAIGETIVGQRRRNDVKSWSFSSGLLGE